MSRRRSRAEVERAEREEEARLHAQYEADRDADPFRSERHRTTEGALDITPVARPWWDPNLPPKEQQARLQESVARSLGTPIKLDQPDIEVGTSSFVPDDDYLQRLAVQRAREDASWDRTIHSGLERLGEEDELHQPPPEDGPVDPPADEIVITREAAPVEDTRSSSEIHKATRKEARIRRSKKLA